jgi:hypothetical protein
MSGASRHESVTDPARRSLIALPGALVLLSGATLVPAAQGLDLHVPQAPAPVRAGSGRRLTYELHLWNLAREPQAIRGVVVEDAVSGHRLAGFGAADIAARLRDGLGAALTDVPAGGHALLYIEIDLPGGAEPRALRHMVDHVSAGGAGPPHRVSGGVTPVASASLPVLGPPLRSGPWVAVHDPLLDRGHRRYLYAVDGAARIPARFAIDWMRAPGPGGAPPDGAGAEVLAVADGVVAALRDGVPDPVAGAVRPNAMEDAAGNFIALDIGGGSFAFYEHLRPGLRVRLGMRVRRGQVIGMLGATGQADRSHLHFHLADAASPLGAEGQPYLLEGAQKVGGYSSIHAFLDGKPWTPGRGSSLPSFPQPCVVVMFPEADPP